MNDPLRPLRFVLDGRPVAVERPDPSTMLLDWLRLSARAVGTKEGCAEGDCGACTVVLARRDADGTVRAEPCNACIRPLASVDGCGVLTVEGLGGEHPVQRAMVEGHGSQCGFCTPGFVTAMAARLAARAGLRVGAGVVTLASPRDALAVNAAHLEAVMLVAADTADELEDACSAMDAVIIGPAAGIEDGTREKVFALGRIGAALVIDADAITVFRQSPGDLFALLDVDDVLTPHEGEFERLFPGKLTSAPTRIDAAREAALKAGAVVVLKGADTVVAHPDGRAAINLNAPPWLATAGAGDVLAGLIGGLLAQGASGFDAACAGAWIHAEAAERFGPGLVSEDLPGLVPEVLSNLYARN